jgi:SMC interacting uncharacterized protein involved in chromosome segregation
MSKFEHKLDAFIDVLKKYASTSELTEDIISTLKNAYDELKKIVLSIPIN